MRNTELLASELNRFGLEGLEPEEVLHAALATGGEFAEIYFERTSSSVVVLDDGRLDDVIDGSDRGAGIRVIFDKRSVQGYTTDLRQASLLALARALAAAVTGGAGGDGERRLAEGVWQHPARRDARMLGYSIGSPTRGIPLERKIEVARRAESGARSKLPSLKQVSASVADTERRILVVNSDGTVAPDMKNYLQMFVRVVAEKNGRTETAHHSDGGFVGMELFERTPPEHWGSEAARRVAVLLDAVPAPAGTLPVVIAAEAGGTMIHEAVGHGLEADLAGAKLSVYAGKVGEQVASPLVTVVDDGGIPALRGSFTVDDEGTPSQKNVLIENGVLKGYMVDRLSAMRYDLPATGNGRRESFRAKPIVRMTNTFIAPGAHDPARILAETSHGIFVKAMGGGQVDTVTGNFVFAVTEGYLIRDGRLAEPIRGATLVGNGPEVLRSVDRVGNDLGFITGTCGKDGQGAPVTDAQPTLRIPALTVGGEVPAATYFPGVS